LRDVLASIHMVQNPDSRKFNATEMAGKAVVRTISPAVKTPVTTASVLLQQKAGVPADKVKNPFSGYTADPNDGTWRSLLPLLVQGAMRELESGNGPAKAAWTAGREFVGTSVQSYPKPQTPAPKRPKPPTRPGRESRPR